MSNPYKERFSSGEYSAVEIMRSVQNVREVGNNGGDIVQYAAGFTGVPWCAALVTQAMLDGNQGHWLEDCSNRLDVVELRNHAARLGLTTSLSAYTPSEGSLLFERSGFHVVMITGVTRDENGVPIGYEITHGNYSDKVTVENLTPQQLNARMQDMYVDARKIDQYHENLIEQNQIADARSFRTGESLNIPETAPEIQLADTMHDIENLLNDIHDGLTTDIFFDAEYDAEHIAAPVSYNHLQQNQSVSIV